MGLRRGMALALLLSGILAVVGCDIETITVAVPDDVFVAEVHLRWEEGAGDARALIHRSFGRETEPVPHATVRIRDQDGREEELAPVGREHCMARAPGDDFRVGCYRLKPGQRDIVRPGGRFSVAVVFDSGERLEGVTTMPEDFEIVRPGLEGPRCGIAPEAGLPLVWTRAAGAWGYRPEAALRGLRKAFASHGIEVRTDPVVLVGLAVSEADTTIAFPSEFGIFSRFSDDGNLLLALQDGLPTGASARIAISAMDRNGANWSRGAGFNPSGRVRIPSLFGEGTGVAASTVVRVVEIEVDPDETLPPCVAGSGAG